MSDKGTSNASVVEDVDKESSTAFGNEKLPEEGSPERLLAEKKLVRKLDSRLLPTIFVIFIMNYIDVSFKAPRCTRSSC